MAVHDTSITAPIARPGLSAADAPAELLSHDQVIALLADRIGIEQTIETLIGLLDAADAPAEDLEDGHDAESDFDGEATLGAPEQHHNQTKWAKGANTEDGERELSLGAPEQHPGPYGGGSGAGCQLVWAAGNKNSARDEGEPEADFEPWLGAPEAAVGSALLQMDQTCWARGCDTDREADAGDECEAVDEDGDDLDRGEGPDDNGIVDRDGADEQWALRMGGVVV